MEKFDSFKGIDSSAILQATYDFPLVFHCNYVSSTVSEILSLISKI